MVVLPYFEYHNVSYFKYIPVHLANLELAVEMLSFSTLENRMGGLGLNDVNYQSGSTDPSPYVVGS